MTRRLEVDPSSATPIWSQIEEGVRRLVASGALAAGALVPSVRDLAGDLRVNPATVSKAYQRLTEQGVLVVRRGEGTYVADQPPKFSRQDRTHLLREGALRYANLAVTVGVPRSEASAEVRDAFDRLERQDARARRNP